MKTRQMGAIPPSAILSGKGIARYGGVSRIGPLSSNGAVQIRVGLELAGPKGGRTLRKSVFLPSKHLLSAFYDTPPSKNPAKNLCLY